MVLEFARAMGTKRLRVDFAGRSIAGGEPSSQEAGILAPAGETTAEGSNNRTTEGDGSWASNSAICAASDDAGVNGPALSACGVAASTCALETSKKDAIVNATAMYLKVRWLTAIA